MGVEKDELTIQEAVAREAQVLRDSTGSSSSRSYSRSYSRSTGSTFSRSTGSTFSRSSRSGRRRRHNNVRISVSGWVEDRRHGRRRRTTDWSGS